MTVNVIRPDEIVLDAGVINPETFTCLDSISDQDAVYAYIQKLIFFADDLRVYFPHGKIKRLQTINIFQQEARNGKEALLTISLFGESSIPKQYSYAFIGWNAETKEFETIPDQVIKQS